MSTSECIYIYICIWGEGEAGKKGGGEGSVKNENKKKHLLAMSVENGASIAPLAGLGVHQRTRGGDFQKIGSHPSCLNSPH